jgi:hypothetical protein
MTNRGDSAPPQLFGSPSPSPKRLCPTSLPARRGHRRRLAGRLTRREWRINRRDQPHRLGRRHAGLGPVPRGWTIVEASGGEGQRQSSRSGRHHDGPITPASFQGPGAALRSRRCPPA